MTKTPRRSGRLLLGAAWVVACLAFSNVSVHAATVNALVVAGGGGGHNCGGGGGGGVNFQTGVDVGVGAIPVTVGLGGLSDLGGGYPNNGVNSAFGSTTAVGGGAGPYGHGAGSGQNGGSGSGGNNGPGGTGVAGQGHAGGAGNVTVYVSCGGGGGAGAAGGSNGLYTPGDGGAGVANSISGSSVTYGGGGGGAGWYSGGAGGAGGGGAGSLTTGNAGTPNTGGGGGSAWFTGGGNGGSGIVIVSYVTGTLVATGGTMTTSSGNTIHTFTSSGTFTVTQLGGPCTFLLSPFNAQIGYTASSGAFSVSTTASCPVTAISNAPWLTVTSTASTGVSYAAAANSDATPRTGAIAVGGQTFTITQAGQPYTASRVNVLVVAGGGGGHNCGGGGGGGVNFQTGVAIDVGAIPVTVGLGGLSDLGGGYPNNGANSAFGSTTAVGGGAGPYGHGAGSGQNGGSGSGGNNGPGGTGVAGQGHAGGAGNVTVYVSCGGGGGAGAAGGSNGLYTPGDGGAGVANSISGSSMTYGGGGGGAGWYSGGAGGAGGGGAGSLTTGNAGTPNTGGGGGSAWFTGGGNGGSGIVIVSYVTGTLIATGGTMTTSGGNTIHTFTSSGTFTITQTSQPIPCTYALSASSLSLDANGGAGAIGLTTVDNCGWTAASSASWLTVSPASGTLSASIAYVAANNATGSTRTATITVGGQTVTVTQTPCVFTFTPGSLSAGSGGASGPVDISALSTCGWTAATSAPWLTVYPSIGRYADQVIADGAAAYWRLNESGGTVAHDSSGHNYHGSYPFPSWISYGLPGGVSGDAAVGGTTIVNMPTTPPMNTTGTVELWVKPTGATSFWYARWAGTQYSTDMRIGVYSQASDNKIHAAFSDGSTMETDIVSVSDLPLNAWTHVALTWDGSTWRLYLNGVSNAAGAHTIVPFTTGVPAYIGWPYPYAIGGIDEVAEYPTALTAQQIANHHTVGIGTAPTGLGTGSILYTATSNPSSIARAAAITVGGQALAVTQAGAPCSYAVSSAPLTFTGQAQNGSLTLTTPDACAWTASSDAAWITFPAASGASSASVAYVIATNPGADRTGTITLGGQMVTVLQRAVCTYSYAPLLATLSPFAGTSTLALTASAPTCAWSAGTTTPWLTMTASGGYAGTVLGDSPVGYWRLGDTALTVVHDELGVHDGTYVGAVLLGQPGLVAGGDGAAYFDTGAYADLGWTAPLTDASGTIEFWITPAGKGPMVVRSAGDHWENQRFAVYSDWMDDKYHVAFADSVHAQYDIVSTSDIVFNVPTHVTVTWNAGVWSIYLNGVLDATGAQTVVPYTWDSTLRIGYAPGMTFGYAHAMLDEVALYDHALTAGAVSAHYAARTSLPLLGSGVIAYHRDQNPTLTARSGSLQIEDDVVPMLQTGLAPRLDLNGIVAPATAVVTPGQTIQVRVQDGPGDPHDWLGLYAAGSDDVSPLAIVYLSGTTAPPGAGLTTATVPFTLPTTPGTYEVRFFWNEAMFKLATSGPIMVGGPNVSITSPTAGATFGAGETVTLSAYASDYGAGITRVDFYADGALVNPITSPPWTTGWGSVVNGAHTLTAVATDASGIAVTSSGVTVTIVGGSLSGGTCTASLSTASASWSAVGGSGAVAVTTQGGCQWAALSPVDWVHTSGSGTVSGSASYVVDANLSATARTASMTIAGQLFVVFQNASDGGSGSGGSCSYTVSPYNIVVEQGGGTQVLTVSAPSGCVSTILSYEPWIVPDVTQGSGTWTATLTVGPNPTSDARVTTLQLAGTSVVIEQSGAGSGGGGTPSGIRRFISSTGQTAAVTMLVSSSAPVVDVPWLTAQVDGATGVLTYSATAAPLGTAREGHIVWGTTTVTIVQPAAVFDSPSGLWRDLAMSCNAEFGNCDDWIDYTEYVYDLPERRYRPGKVQVITADPSTDLIQVRLLGDATGYLTVRLVGNANEPGPLLFDQMVSPGTYSQISFGASRADVLLGLYSKVTATWFVPTTEFWNGPCHEGSELDYAPCAEKTISLPSPPFGRGIWAKSHLAVQIGVPIANLQFFHVSLRLTPNDQGDFVRRYPQYFFRRDEWNNYYATIGAGPHEGVDIDWQHCLGDFHLTSGIDRPSDLNEPPQPMFEHLNYAPDQEDQLIDKLLRLAVFENGGYANDLWYYCDPGIGSGYNSNSFIAGLLIAAGIAPPQYPGNHLPDFPGWPQPVPSQYFYR